MIISKYHPGTRWRLRVLRAILPISKDDVVLDAGCGDGYISAELTNFARQVIGVDISHQTIEKNRKIYKLNNLELVY